MSFSIPKYAQDQSDPSSAFHILTLRSSQETTKEGDESDLTEFAALASVPSSAVDGSIKNHLVDSGVLVADTLDYAYHSGKISSHIVEANDFHSTLVLKTSDIHKVAVKSPFLQSLLKASFCPTQFTKYLINLQKIHYHLENVQQKIPQESPASRFVFRELWKFRDLEEDIGNWKSQAHGPSLERDNIAKSTNEYIEHLENVSQRDPDILVAHLWVFYGTLLSGGQMIGRSIMKVYNENLGEKGLSAQKENEGAQFFQFPFTIASFKKDRWYPALNSVFHATKDEFKSTFCDRVVEESNTAFKAVLDFVEEIKVGAC